ncbi:MAG: glycosyltransferase [Verrucomicrobia bacterium]|jgi:glycosyltransferase involved in cell wall biosynthesis|nr:glycosyltransferase [Verrucomicrobiota bacterium]
MRFSIITPSLNNRGWLELCAASVTDQQGVEVEHIVQDGGSTDGTGEWLKTHPEVRGFVEKDQGMYDAVNRGFRRATGEVLAWLNCDEQYLPGALQTVAKVFKSNPAIDMVFGDIVLADNTGRYLCHRRVERPLLHHTWVCHLSTLSCAMFFRSRLLASRDAFLDTSYRCGGDGEWMVRLLRRGVRMIAVRHFTSLFTLHGDNLSRSAMAREEWRRLRNTAPAWVRTFSPIWILHHRIRRLIHGSYRQTPFAFSAYTPESPKRRIEQFVAQPTFRCP